MPFCLDSPEAGYSCTYAQRRSGNRLKMQQFHRSNDSTVELTNRFAPVRFHNWAGSSKGTSWPVRYRGKLLTSSRVKNETYHNCMDHKSTHSYSKLPSTNLKSSYMQRFLHAPTHNGTSTRAYQRKRIPRLIVLEDMHVNLADFR